MSEHPNAEPELSRVLDEVLAKLADDLVDLRRDLHAHPELSWQERRTTSVVAERLSAAGLAVSILDRGGMTADIGTHGPVVALRADLDALPVDDLGNEPWSSTVPGVAHACGHDVHTSALAGAALALHEAAGRGLLPGRVRLLFQPAEEVMPGGALSLIGEGLLDDVSHVFGMHCDPALDVGKVGLREGPLTGAADSLEIRLQGRGGHTSRPHLTEDLTFALGKLVTELPAILSRRLDPRVGASIVWGQIQAGAAPNVIPASGRLAGTIRMLDAVAWGDAERLVRGLVSRIVEPYGVTADITYHRGVPPVVNEHVSTTLLGHAVVGILGEDGLVPTVQSLGGEDFGWFLDRVPGAMARLGTRTPNGPTYDLHQGNLRIDERAVGIGARLLARVAVEALGSGRARDLPRDVPSS